jgi:hypothetical protein
MVEIIAPCAPWRDGSTRVDAPLADELEHHGRDEGLGDAADAEPAVDRYRRAGVEVGHARAAQPVTGLAGHHRDRAGRLVGRPDPDRVPQRALVERWKRYGGRLGRVGRRGAPRDRGAHRGGDRGGTGESQ